MKFCLKIVILSFWFFVAGWVFATAAFAEGEISSSHRVSYDILGNGKTNVTHQISLTNLTTSYYASEYALFLGYTDIKNIEANDSLGPLVENISPRENGTDIHVTFNDRVVGKGKSLSFTISYETSQVASQSGRIWEVTIPRIRDAKDIEAYTITIHTPASFGKPTYIKPKQQAAATNPLVFTKEEVFEGISVVFGEYQLFNFSLTYHLRNNRLYPVITEIALPPKTSYQDIILDSLVPTPLTIYQDEDGNWLAKYRLEASEKLDIKALGKAKLFHEPVNKMPETKKDLAIYLRGQKYWETQDLGILEKAKELKTPRKIYAYVVATLTYDVNRTEESRPRLGALDALAHPTSAVCMEFTDLFIALARATGIPAREIDGFGYTGNTKLRPLSLVKDILHAWPEYYDGEKEMWIAVDPTWGNTSGIDYFDTFDFNHLAFVIKGRDSEYPNPAGSYKENLDLEKQDVEVTFAKDDSFEETRSVSVTTDINNTIIAGLPTSAHIIITNNGNKLFEAKDLTVTMPSLLPQMQKIPIGPVPPYGNTKVEVSFRSPSYFDHFKTSVKAKIQDKDLTYELQIMPLYLVYLPWIGGGSVAGLLFFIAHKTWRVYIQRPKGSGSLRGKSK